MLLISLTIHISSASFEFLLTADLGFIRYMWFIFRCFGTMATWRGQLNHTILNPIEYSQWRWTCMVVVWWVMAVVADEQPCWWPQSMTNSSKRSGVVTCILAGENGPVLVAPEWQSFLCEARVDTNVPSDFIAATWTMAVEICKLLSPKPGGQWGTMTSPMYTTSIRTWTKVSNDSSGKVRGWKREWRRTKEETRFLTHPQSELQNKINHTWLHL